MDLVFGDLEEEQHQQQEKERDQEEDGEEVFCTPLTSSRASSLGAAQQLPHPPLAVSTAALAKAFGSSAVHTSAPDAAEPSPAATAAADDDDASAPRLEDPPQQSQSVDLEQLSGSGADASASASDDDTLSSTTATSTSEQELAPAPLPARQQQQQLASMTAAGDASAAASGSSALSLGNGSSSTSTRADSELAAARGAAEEAPSRDARREPQEQQQQQQQQQQSDSPLKGLGHQQQQQPHSPPVSPHAEPATPPAAAGLERAASWQLQHAAAAAAGTAAQPAPPRSDIHLSRLSSPVSPACEDGWAAWQRHRRHFFVLTAAGKPVYSRHGDEQALAGFMAVIQALISVVADQGDAIRSITVGSSSITFLLRGSLYLVAVSSREEAPAALRRQLELLYQAIIMTVTSGVERLLQRSPGYDLCQLLSGSKGLLNGLLAAAADCPGWMMGSVEPAAAAAADRAAAAAALQAAVKSTESLYGLLLAGRRVVVVETGRGPPPLNVFDLLLLTNFTACNESLRHSETFVPICLPNFQPSAFLHAYVACLDSPEQQQQAEQQQSQQQSQQSQQSSSSLFLLLLSGSADSFHKLSAARQAFAAALGPAAAVPAAAGGGGAGPGGVLARLAAIAARPGGGRIKVESFPAPLGGPVGVSPLWHAVIRFPQRKQHLTLHHPPSLFTGRAQLKQLARSYCRLYCAAYCQLLEQQQQQPLGSSSSSSSSSSSGFQVPAGGASGGPTAGAGGGSSGIAGIVGAAASGGSAGAGGGGMGSAAAAAAAYMLHQPARPHRLVWVSSLRWVTGVLVDRDVEVYVTFDPLTDKETGLSLAEQLKRIFADKGRQAELLLPGL